MILHSHHSGQVVGFEIVSRSLCQKTNQYFLGPSCFVNSTKIFLSSHICVICAKKILAKSVVRESDQQQWSTWKYEFSEWFECFVKFLFVLCTFCLRAVYVECINFSRPWVCDRRSVGIELFGPPYGTTLLLLLLLFLLYLALVLKLFVNLFSLWGSELLILFLFLRIRF